MGAKVDWDDKFRQYAKRKKWKFGRCPSKHSDTKDAIEKCNKTYGLRKISTGEKFDCSCGYHGTKTTNNEEEEAASHSCSVAQSCTNEGAESPAAQDNNHQQPHHKPSVPNPTTAKRPKTVYTNAMFTDSNGNPIPYCDNDDPPNPDDGKWVMNDEIERDFGQWLKKRKAAWRGNRRRGNEEEEVPVHCRKMPPESLTVTVEYGFPTEKPIARQNASEVKGTQHWPAETRNHYPLDTFCPDDGRCIHCGGRNMKVGKNTKTVRAILCNGLPRFVQSLSIVCMSCKKSFMAYDKSYLDTLDSLAQKQKLNAIIDGKSNGIDMALIIAQRNGTSPEELERTARTNLQNIWSASKEKYDNCCKALRREGHTIDERPFPPFPEKYVPKADQLSNAFLRDFATEVSWLKRELATGKSSTTLAIDYQVKVARRAKTGKDEVECLSFSILGDMNIVLAHVIVPSESQRLSAPAIEEVVARHGEKPPSLCYVDGNPPCCNRKQGGRSEKSKMLHGMEKKLDARHLIDRIGEAINGNHRRRGAFLRDLSSCIFTPDPTDVAKLESARSKHRQISGDSTRNGKASHDRKHLRSVIEEGSKVGARIIAQVKKEAKIDEEAKRRFPCPQQPTPSNPAYPLITTQVWRVIKQQLTHVLNGCLSDDGVNMYIVRGHENYRNTGVTLPVYHCLRGTSNVEALNSLLALKSHDWHHLRRSLFDARTFWIIINYNRGQLQKFGKNALLPGVSPSEASLHGIELATAEDGEKVKFGFEYCSYITKKFKLNSDAKTKSRVAILLPKQSKEQGMEMVKAGNLQDITVPGEVGFEELDSIGNALERVLPDAESLASIAVQHASVASPPNLRNECNQLAHECKQQKVVGSGSLRQRQEAAIQTMTANGISTERDTIPSKKRTRCKVCGKDRRTFTFQGRRHIQLSKSEKGATIQRYCPLVDPPEMYDATLKQRMESERIAQQGRNARSYAKRRKLK
jgi:hypothetical protein